MKKFSEIDSDHYSKYTLRRFAAVVNTAGWIAFMVVTWAICVVIEWWTA